jgi:hypothetical protein
VNQLRDPAVYEESGRTYLLYAVAGESGSGIAIAEVLSTSSRLYLEKALLLGSRPLWAVTASSWAALRGESYRNPHQNYQ